MRKEFAYVWEMTLAEEVEDRDSAMRSMVEGRKFPRAPWRRREPISSSSKTPTSFMMPSSSVDDVEAAEASSPSMADQEQSLSSIRPAKMNSFSRPPIWAGWMS